MFFYVLLLPFLYSSFAFSMFKPNPQKQLEIAAGRKTYVTQAKAHREEGFCVFCDAETLKNNCVILEDPERDLRVFMNKNPYFTFDQGQQLLLKTISHVEEPEKVTQKQLASLCYELQKLSAVFYHNSYGQEVVFNLGTMAGQSVKHLHWHFKNYQRKPLSVPLELKARKNPTITTLEQAFTVVQMLLTQAPLFKPVINVTNTIESEMYENCLCCLINLAHVGLDYLVVERFQHNYVCLSHYPTLPGELSVVPYQHASPIKDLPQESYLENMAIAMALLRKTQEYAQENIRESGGGNIYTKSRGTMNDKAIYHVHTLVMPRTIISATPGTLEGHSCKLDYDPEHYYAYVKGIIAEVKTHIEYKD